MSQTTLTAAKTYTIDPNHSTVRFWVRHLMIAKVHGELTDISGTVTYDSANPEQSQANAVIKINSLTTGNEQRDAHLKSADFFSADQHPEITFTSKSITRKGGNDYEVKGDLTMLGVTREITLEAEVTDEIASPFGGYKIGVSATTVIDREDFGMKWNQALETGGVMVGKEIHLSIDVELDRA